MNASLSPRDIPVFAGNCPSTPSGITWFLYAAEIQPGKSAILAGNHLVFYGMHITAIVFILISLVSCVSVIVSVCRNKRDHWDFSDRFPFYLAISDTLWALSNLSGDHIVLLIRPQYPEKRVAALLGINVFLFFGYQQLMNAGLSLFTYMKVVRRVKLRLGSWEWKLHTFVISLLLIQVGIYWCFGAFGSSGYLFLLDINKLSGIILGVNVCISCSIHAVLTLVAYRAIQNVINNQEHTFSMNIIPSPKQQLHQFNNNNSTQIIIPTTETEQRLPHLLRRHYSTTTECLTTFIYISICLYVPFAVVGWSCAIFSCFGLIEPLSAFAAVIAANSGGWVNALGYFRNKKVKERRRKILMRDNFRVTLCFVSDNHPSVYLDK
ncbi:uncharacterized protein LOC110854166 [Folsomia candida]|uniref:uncharacterized protein LOC110854166 n=1 Tax=Folsomia candida TaxID=158441 RepID=UPI0016053F62|nr:uncharacterized protein LOC110854166 [Folsomia candida]